jgi:hypothetical protein
MGTSTPKPYEPWMVARWSNLRIKSPIPGCFRRLSTLRETVHRRRSRQWFRLSRSVVALRDFASRACRNRVALKPAPHNALHLQRRGRGIRNRSPPRAGASFRVGCRRIRRFLRTQADTILASDFFTVYSLWGTPYVLFFIELSSRRVHVAGCTARPDSVWVTQQARNLLMFLEDRGTPVQYLIHDRDAKYGGGFDEVFRADGVDVSNPDQGTARQRLRRTMGEDGQDGAPRLDLDRRTAPHAGRPGGLCRALQLWLPTSRTPNPAPRA